MTQPILVNPTAAGGSRRLKVLLGIALAILLVGLLGPRLLFSGGGDDGAESTAFFPEPGATSIPTTVPTTVPTTPPAPVAVSSGSPGRNPFSPTVAVAPVANAPAPTVPVATTVPRAAPARSTARFRVLEISLDAAAHPMARVRLNDVAQTVSVGQVFSERYRVVSLDVPGRCGQFVAGGVKFSLCEGDERLA